MALHAGIGRGPGHLNRSLKAVAGGGGLGPGIVTAVEVLGDIGIAITSPSAQTVPMQTNGSTVRIATSGTAATAAVDLSKITLSVSDQGWDATGAQVAHTRTIGLNAALLGPYNQIATYQPNAGEFYFKLDDLVFNQDATWKTTITAVNFAAGWIAGQPAGQVTNVTRSDSLAYPPTPVRTPTAPWQRLAVGNTYPVEVIPVSRFARNLSQVACVEAWIVDSAATAGAVARTSAFSRSPSTPIGGGTGRAVPSYQLNLDATGLLAGRVDWRWTVKPWIGPSISSATVGDVWPTLNPAVGVPFCYDTDGSHAPLYVCLAFNNTLPAGKTLLVNTGTATSVGTSGVSTTAAGAIASGVVYTDLFALRAVQKVNASAVNVTIADPATGANSFLYKRATPHNDHSGAVLLCESVSTSVPGSDTGAYSLFNNLSAEPVGLNAAEIRSATGAVDDTIRWRGRHTDGTVLVLSGRRLPLRVRLRWLYLDSVGTTANTEEIVFSGNGLTSQVVASSEAAANYQHVLDCKLRNDNAAGSNGPLYTPGFAWHERLDWFDVVIPYITGSAVISGGLVSTIGCTYAATAHHSTGMSMSGVFGTLFTNMLSQGPTSGNRPAQKSRIHYNCEFALTATGWSSAATVASQGNCPAIGGEGWCMVHVWGTDATATGGIGFSNDSVKYEADHLIIQHLGSAWPNSVSGTGRLNVSYNEQGVVRINKRLSISYAAIRSWNIKGDSFNAPESAASSTDPTKAGTNAAIGCAGTAAWDTTKTYFKGQVAFDSVGLHGYQAVQDVPTGIALTNTTYWLDTGTSTTPYGPQTLRQGNADARYQVGCFGNVASETADSTFPSNPPGTISWYGYCWGKGGAFNQTWSTYYNNTAANDYTPKPGTSPLLNRVPAGMAVTPFDINGVTLLNDGTDAAGPLQIPH